MTIAIIEVRAGSCQVCMTKDNLVALQFRAKVLRFCRPCLGRVRKAIEALEAQGEQEKSN